MGVPMRLIENVQEKKNMLSLLTQMVLEIVVFLVFPRYSHVQTNPLHVYGLFQIILKWSKGVTDTSQYSRFSNKLQTFSRILRTRFREPLIQPHRSKALVVKVIHFLSPWLLKLENSCSFIFFVTQQNPKSGLGREDLYQHPQFMNFHIPIVYGPKKRCTLQ